MTYREKYQVEHPDRVRPGFVGGCSGCPHHYYDADDKNAPCHDLAYGSASLEVKCRACWDRVIPTASETEELKNRIEELEGRVGLLTSDLAMKGVVIANKDKEIDELKLVNKELQRVVETKERAIVNLERGCSAKNEVINELRRQLDIKTEIANKYRDSNDNKRQLLDTKDKTIDDLRDEKKKLEDKAENLEKELNDERTRKYFWCEDNCCAMTKDREIAKLKNELESKKAIIACKDFTIKGQEDTIQGLNHTLAVKELDLIRVKRDLNEQLRYTGDLLNMITMKNKELDDEKKEHAKHHGIVAIFRKI